MTSARIGNRIQVILGMSLWMISLVFASDGDVLSDVRQTLIRKEQALRTLGFEYKYTRTSVESKKEDISDMAMVVSTRHSGNRKLVCMGPHSLDEREVIVSYDGERSYFLIHTTEVRDQFITQNGAAPLVHTYPSPAAFICETLDGDSFHSLMTEHDYKQVKASRSGDEACVSVVYGDDALEYEYFFDPSKDYTLTRFNTKRHGQLSKKGTIISSESVHVDEYDFQIVLNGKVEVFDLESGELSYTEEITVDRYEINEEYPDDLFVLEIDPTKRTAWYDKNLQKGMILGAKEHQEENVRDLEVEEAADIEMTSETASSTMLTAKQPEYPPMAPGESARILAAHKKNSRQVTYAIVLAIAVLACIALAVLRGKPRGDRK